MSDALTRKLFFIPSFKIYGSVAGFYDYGPPGCALKRDVTSLWRNHFVLEEGMLEVECPAVTPEPVLRASGHVERFTDLMVSDAVTGDCHRADHLLEDLLEARLEPDSDATREERARARDLLARVGELGAEELGAELTALGATAPGTGNAISAPFPFNLMFRTSIGPRGDQVGFLRPETAQGIFVNFRDLLYYNAGKLPFAAAQIGSSYRNEISPRSGLLRVREFTQAEIEHFVNPEDKSHPKFHEVADLEVPLYSRELQMGAEKRARPRALGEAVAAGVVANETLAYFVGRTFLFAKRIGLDPARVRFRQHLEHEMAHYAADCWDCEVECSYGWIECAGLADRSAYDLKAHAAASGQDLTAYERFDEPKEVEAIEAVPNKKVLGQTFKADAKLVAEALEKQCDQGLLDIKAAHDEGRDAQIEVLDAKTGRARFLFLPPGSVEITQGRKKVHGRSFTPGVIEPSFGIGRFLYVLFEHAFYTRPDDAKRGVFRFPPAVAPTKAVVLPLVAKPVFADRAKALAKALTKAGVSSQIDTTGTTVGRRYARADEIGVPFALTVDGQTVEDDTVTLRERDSTAQVRVPAAEAPALLRKLVGEELVWSDVTATYPIQAAKADE